MKIKKLLLFALTILVSVAGLNVHASGGYSYNHKGEPMHSEPGFKVDALKSYEDLKIPVTCPEAKDYAPADLFVFKRKTEKPLIYLVDEKLNRIFTFDDEFNMLQDFNHCKLYPDKLYATNLTAVSSDGSIMFAREDAIPTPEELNDPAGKYQGKGYIELNFNHPKAVYRAVLDTGEDYIYICDYGNSQIVVLDANSFDEDEKAYSVHQIITKPIDEMQGSNQKFLPTCLIVDAKGRIYVIVETVLQGIMQFKKDGTFARYTGTNRITLSAWDIFWRNISNEAQKKAKAPFVPTTFNSLAYDPDKFMIYTVSLAIKNKSGTDDNFMIKKINTAGDDVTRRSGYSKPKGDVYYEKTSTLFDKETGSSQLCGITFNEHGIYSVFDKKRGKIFTYDNDGHLLYISGEKGLQRDKLNEPVAIQYLGDDLLVLDKYTKTIIRFGLTEIGSLINDAVKCEKIGYIVRTEPKYNEATKTWFIGKENTMIKDPALEVSETKSGTWKIGTVDTGIKVPPKAASDYWEDVIKLNANFEYAYVGIGQKYMKQKDYRQAMHYFKLGHKPDYYSKAFKLQRDLAIKKHFTWVAVTLTVIVVGGLVWRHQWRKKTGYKKEEETGVGDE